MDLNRPSKTIDYTYHYQFGNNREITINVELDAKTLALVNVPASDTYPSWARLDFNRCPNCTLANGKDTLCPVAGNLVHVINTFGHSISYDRVTLRITAPSREYSKATSLMEAISSLVGIYMVTSGCPVLDKLRPMVKYHLPFATLDEAKYRAIAMYLMAQYVRYKAGKDADWQLQRLGVLYDEIRAVNLAFSKRLQSAISEDASINALVKLDCFADVIAFSIHGDDLYNAMKDTFDAFLK